MRRVSPRMLFISFRARRGAIYRLEFTEPEYELPDSLSTMFDPDPLKFSLPLHRAAQMSVELNDEGTQPVSRGSHWNGSREFSLFILSNHRLNQFFFSGKCLHLSGLTPEPLTADDDYKLLRFGIGFTNMVARATKGSADLTRKEIKEGQYTRR